MYVTGEYTGTKAGTGSIAHTATPGFNVISSVPSDLTGIVWGSGTIYRGASSVAYLVYPWANTSGDMSNSTKRALSRA